MSTKADAIREWRKLFNSKQDKPQMRFALTGDGSSATTADVNNRAGFAWVRYNEEPDKVSQVRNAIMPGVPQDVPVIIGKKFVTDYSVQILGINQALYDMYWGYDGYSSYLLPAHGSTHHAVSGSDPAYIDVRNILNGRLRPTNPVSLSVYAESFAYSYQDERALFSGEAVSLAGDLPGAANYRRYALISFDVVEQGLRKILGATSPAAVSATPPSTPIWNVPLGLVLLEQGMVSITDSSIYDYRVLFEPIGNLNTYRNLVQYMAHNDEVLAKHLIGEI